MTILLTTPWKLTAVGGISTVVKMLSHEFYLLGHQTLVLTTDGDGRVLRMDETDGTPVYEMYLRSPCVENAQIRGLVSFVLFLPITLYRLRRFLLSHQVDVVTIQYPLANIAYLGILRWFSRWKLVVTFQGNDAHDLHQWSALERLLVTCLLASADSVIAVSKTLLDKVKRVCPLLKYKRSYVVGNGAPLKAAVFPNHGDRSSAVVSEYVFAAGQLIQRKGFDVLVKALRVVTDLGIEMNVVIAGDGSEKEPLTKLAQEEGVSEFVQFVGAQSHEAILTLMQNSRFFVLPSRAEGMPLVIAEAMACGKAVIATNVDGVPEIVRDGSTGILVEPDNVEVLARALVKLSTDASLRESFGKLGREWALKEHNWRCVANRYLEVFSAR
jgi:glycosyltransferase involved in cell wall biosynthesis